MLAGHGGVAGGWRWHPGNLCVCVCVFKCTPNKKQDLHTFPSASPIDVGRNPPSSERGVREDKKKKKIEKKIVVE